MKTLHEAMLKLDETEQTKNSYDISKKELEERLKHVYNQNALKPQQLTFFGKPEKQKSLDECYQKHGEKIAYKKDSGTKQSNQHIDEDEYD